MTALANSIPLPVMARKPIPAVEPCSSALASADADASAIRLTSAVARGEEAAFREFYDAYYGRLFRLVFVLGRGDDALAQDVVQAVFLVAAAKLPAVNCEEHLWNWLARVARQQLAKVWRQRQREAAVIGMAEVPDCPDPVEPDRLLEEGLNAALLAMDAEDRELVEWFYFDRLSQKEIAEKLGGTPKAVSSRLERARAKLRLLITRKLSHET